MPLAEKVFTGTVSLRTMNVDIGTNDQNELSAKSLSAKKIIRRNVPSNAMYGMIMVKSRRLLVTLQLRKA